MAETAAERELRALRQRVAELQRRLDLEVRAAAAGALDSAVVMSEREKLLVEAERVARMGSWIWNIDDNQVHWSDELYRILGHDPSTHVASAESFFDVVHADDVERVRATSERSVSSGVMEDIDYRVTRPDGSVRHVTMAGAALYDAAGVLKRIVGTVQDITEEREAAEAMARAHAELEEAQAIAALGSWTVDLAKQHLTWSTELRRILGVPQDEIATPEGFLARIHPDDRARMQATHERAIITGEFAEAEARVVREDSVRRVKVKGVPQLDERGEVTLIRGTVQDVTEQRLLEEQLAHAQKMEAIGRLAGGVAHDLNNHLMVIEGNLAVLQLPSSPELEALRSAINAASQTTSRLLAFGRSSPLRRRSVDPNHLVGQTLLLLERVIAEDITLCSVMQADLPRIDVDEGMMGQCLGNLVLNARDAVSSGGTIELRTMRSADDPNAIEIAVRDDGTGIDDATKAHVFEPFFTTKPQGKGSGLGLSMVQGTVIQHGGAVTVSSEVGRGTTFTLRLPVADVAVATTSAPPVSSLKAARRSTVLVVEDQAPVAAVIRRLLEAEGHRVLVAARPRLALDLVRAHGEQIDVIVSDVVMPEMRGPALVEEIQRTTGRTYPVVFMSGYSREEGASDDFVRLRKPFVREELLQALSEVLPAPREAARIA